MESAAQTDRPRDRRAGHGAESTSERLHPSERMRSAKDFRLAYAEGARGRGPSLTVVLRPNGRGFSRLGLSVGKRCWKQAVRRNRVRRVFREAFRLSRPELPAGVDVVMIASCPKLKPRLAELQSELLRLSAKAQRRVAEAAGPTGSP